MAILGESVGFTIKNKFVFWQKVLALFGFPLYNDRAMNDITSENAIAAAMKKFPKAKKNAVYNVGYGNAGRGMTLADSMNVEADAASYKWNRDTVNAIRFVYNYKGGK